MTLLGKLIACTSQHHNWDIVFTEYGDYDTPEAAAQALIQRIDYEGIYALGDISVYRITSCEVQLAAGLVPERVKGPWLLYDFSDGGKRYICSGELVKKFNVYTTYELVETKL